MDGNGWSTRQLARELSVAQPQVVRRCRCSNLPGEVQDQVEQGALAPATAYEIGKLDNPDDRSPWPSQVVADKLTRQEAVEAVRRHKNGHPATTRAPIPPPLEIRVSDAVTVTVRYRKADRLTPVQALRLALKHAQASEKAHQADQDEAA